MNITLIFTTAMIFFNRRQSAALYQDVKIITENQQGCVIRVFDLKHDPFEQRNLVVNHQHCSLTFTKHDIKVSFNDKLSAYLFFNLLLNYFKFHFQW